MVVVGKEDGEAVGVDDMGLLDGKNVGFEDNGACVENLVGGDSVGELDGVNVGFEEVGKLEGVGILVGIDMVGK